MYQPIGDVQSHEIAYVEALCRWNHPVQGFIPPEEFIAIAEQMGLIPQITDFVFNEGCAQLARWREAGITIGLAVNVSGREFADINLVERVQKCLRQYDIPAHLLTLEVTETEIMADLGAATKVLYALSDLGVKLGIDDYGTGYSSLQYLHTLPVNELKIDRSFVTNLPSEDSNRIIVQSSIQMAHNLGLYVIAEGAEDELTCAMLAEARVRLHPGVLPVQAPEGGRPPGVDPRGSQARVRTRDHHPRLQGCGAHADVEVRLTAPPARTRLRAQCRRAPDGPRPRGTAGEAEAPAPHLPARLPRPLRRPRHRPRRRRGHGVGVHSHERRRRHHRHPPDHHAAEHRTAGARRAPRPALRHPGPQRHRGAARHESRRREHDSVHHPEGCPQGRAHLQR